MVRMVEINSSRDLSLVEFSNPPGWIWTQHQTKWFWWRGSLQGCFRSGELKVLEKTVATLQAQLKGPHSTTSKVTAFNAIVELVKETVPTEVLVSMDSTQKRGRGECFGLWPNLSLSYHEMKIRPMCCWDNPPLCIVQDRPTLSLDEEVHKGREILSDRTYLF